MRASRVSAVVAVVAILAISLYSAYTINGVITSNAPTVAFTLGSAYRDVTYCNAQTLDLYVPTAAARPLPLAVFVHGGGFHSGDKADINPEFLNALASAGYAVASVNYQLAPLAKYPTQFEDVECALRFLHYNAQVYGINGSEMFAFGTSVGGEMVALAALIGSHSVFNVGPYLNESSSIVAGVDLFGPADLISCGCFSNVTTMVFGNNQTLMRLASPMNYIRQNAPPLLLIQGMNDSTVPMSQAVEFYNALAAAGDRTQLIMVQNMGHMFVQVGSNPIDPSLQQMAQDIVSFFGQYRSG